MLDDLVVFEQFGAEGAGQEPGAGRWCAELSVEVENQVADRGLRELAPLVPQDDIGGTGVTGPGCVVDAPMGGLVA